MSETGETNAKQQNSKKGIKKAWNFVVKPKDDGTPDLTSLPLFGPQLAEFDNQIPIKGLPLAVKEGFEKRGVHVIP